MISKRDAQNVVERFEKVMLDTSDEEWTCRIQDDAWTPGEITGHLVDSASNNHQRFVRLQSGNLENMALVYDAEPWVDVQQYAAFDRRQLMGLWKYFNALLLHFIFETTAETRRNVWIIDGKSLSLEFLITDYYKHLEHHCEHFEKRLKEIRSQ